MWCIGRVGRLGRVEIAGEPVSRHLGRIAMTQERRPHVLIIVQNLPVPLDRRVWMECQALVRTGVPRQRDLPEGTGRPGPPADRRGGHLQVPSAHEAKGLVGFAWEFVYSWLRTAWLSMIVWRHRPFDVLQACNPPDTRTGRWPGCGRCAA